MTALPIWLIKNSEEYFSGFAPGGQISTVARAEYALTFMSFGTAQQYAHELCEITGERWEVTAG
jgi:hypothetical protein